VVGANRAGVTGTPTATSMTLAALAMLTWPVAVTVRPTRDRATEPASSTRRAVLLGSAVAAAVLVVNPVLWWFALLGGAGIVLAARNGRSRRRPGSGDLELLAVFCDLFAACLDAGMAVGPSIHAVVSVMRRSGAAPPPGDRPPGPAEPVGTLTSIAAMLELGADPDVAWRHADALPILAPVASGARRSARGGTPLADAVRQHAVELREQIDALGVRAAGRAGVAMTAPLALCFLPGFICLGLAPVIIGLLGQLAIL
jgi:Type II secretion system (T2SS), protein F